MGSREEMDHLEVIKLKIENTPNIKVDYFPNFDFDIDGDEDSIAIVPANKGEEDLPPSADVQSMWDEINAMLDQESQKRGGGRKKKLKASYPLIAKSLEEHAEKYGFSNKQLIQIWKLLVHPGAYLNCKQIKQLLFSMVPAEKINTEVITMIVSWLGRSRGSRAKPSIVVAVYQLLSLYAEYQMMEYDGMANCTLLTHILTAPTENFVVPWKMHLYRLVCTPNILVMPHVKELVKLLRHPKIKKTQAEDVKGSLMISFDANEELSSLNYKTESKAKLRTLSFPRGVRERFSNCNVRVQLQAVSVHHPLANYVFPEFLPSIYRTQDYMNKTLMEIMLELLETEDHIVQLAQSSPMLLVFEQWLKYIIDYRLSTCSPFIFVEDLPRYQFIFDVCQTICTVRGKGLSSLNQWLVQFLCNWDFEIFEAFVYNLIPYLDPQDVYQQSVKAVLLSKLSNCFIAFEESQLDLWEAFTALFFRWMKNLPGTESIVYRDGLRWLQKLCGQFVTSAFAITTRAIQPYENPILLKKMISFYKVIHHDPLCKRDENIFLCDVPPTLPALAYNSTNVDAFDEVDSLFPTSNSNTGASSCTEAISQKCIIGSSNKSTLKTTLKKAIESKVCKKTEVLPNDEAQKIIEFAEVCSLVCMYDPFNHPVSTIEAVKQEEDNC